MRFFFILMFVVVALMVSPVSAQNERIDPEAMSQAFYEQFNHVLREEFGHTALARNEILDHVAQDIAQTIACTDNRVQFSIQREAREQGFQTYPGDNSARTTRIPLLPVVNLRPIEELAQFYAADIFQNNINSQGRFYREIGIGVFPCIAVNSRGVRGSTEQYSLFVILGAQPDVIPVVIENGERILNVESVPVTVTLSLHEEVSRPREGIFGAGSKARLSSEPIDDDTPESDFQPFMEWEFEECGINTLYYELTDAANVTVEGSTSIDIHCPDAAS